MFFIHNFVQVEDSLLRLNMGISEVILDCIIAGDLQVQEENRNVARLLDYVEDALNGRVIGKHFLHSILCILLCRLQKFVASNLMLFEICVDAIVVGLVLWQRR